MTDDNTNIGLSRRRILGGLGAIGIASAGAGLGTTAYFSDQESFEGNSLTAGTLAVNVTQQITHIDQDGIGPDELAWTDAGDGEAGVTTDPIVIEDAKPGDEYEFCWEVELEGNPGFAMVSVGNVSEQTGAEAGTVSADDLYDVDTDAEMVTIGEAATAVATLTLCRGEDEEPGAEVEVFEGGLDDLLGALSEGLVVPSSEAVEGDGEFCHDIGCPVTLCLEIEIPTTVGNELQGAESTFDLSVYAEQCRHNDVEQFGNVSVVPPDGAGPA
ncbi:SipW-dependent-type signal peptide-containing protein [Natrarchaeobius sp. A-rgal3]|uniref:SipW-dependent-type signal peptide-containing protein n=1 Tax=Natrarchaeobius versutus TaxID=1679078 RepID=UPI00350E950E